MSRSIPGKAVFPAPRRLSSRGSTHTTVARGTALWESLVGKPRGKASRESHRSLHPREGKGDTAATAREESACACPHSRRGLTPLGRLQKYPKIHVSTGEQSSGFGSDSTHDLRPRHRRERNPESPPSNSHGDWPLLRPPELVAGALRTILGRPQLCLMHALHSQRVTQTLPLGHPTHNHTASTSRETTHLERFPFL